VFDIVVAACFQNVHKSHNVTIHVGVRILNGITYAGLRGQIYNVFWAGLLEDLLDGVPIFDADLLEREPFFA
jgi:hypothetical protein